MIVWQCCLLSIGWSRKDSLQSKMTPPTPRNFTSWTTLSIMPFIEIVLETCLAVYKSGCILFVIWDCPRSFWAACFLSLSAHLSVCAILSLSARLSSADDQLVSPVTTWVLACHLLASSHLAISMQYLTCHSQSMSLGNYKDHNRGFASFNQNW